MKTAIFLAVLSTALAMAGSATFGWETDDTVLGLYGSGEPPIVATLVADPVHSGAQSLSLEDNSPDGTPQAYVAWILGLSDGDEVTASFWRYDVTPGSTPPSCRIWAHWNDDPEDVYGYNGSAGGNNDYGPGTGWDLVEHTWTVEAGHTGLVVEVRTYSEPGDTVFIDDMTITAPDGTTIWTPETYLSLQGTTWAGIKSLSW
jgi:hypothetical protein